MTVFIYFEPNAEGHSTMWADLVLRRALEHPQIKKVRLVAGRTLLDRLADGWPRGFDGVEVETLDEDDLTLLNKGSFSSRGMAQWAKARDLLAMEGGVCFVPFFDHTLLGACLDRRPVNGVITGVIFRPPNRYKSPRSIRSLVDAARRWSMYLASTRAATPYLFTLDDIAAHQGLGGKTKRLIYSPDPAPNLFVERLKKQHRKDGREVLLLFGALSRRKGVILLLQSLSYIPPERQSQLALRLVGRILQNDRADIELELEKARAGNPKMVIECIDRFVSDAELGREIVNADIVLAPYQNHIGSSGVLFWAAAAGRPVVAQQTGLMGYQTELYELGRALDATDPVALAAGLASRPEMSLSRAREFIAEHTADNFASFILDTIFSSPNVASRSQTQFIAKRS